MNESPHGQQSTPTPDHEPKGPLMDARYLTSADEEITAWLTGTEGPDRIGAHLGVQYGIEDRGCGYIAIPVEAVDELKKYGPDQDGRVTEEDGKAHDVDRAPGLRA